MEIVNPGQPNERVFVKDHTGRLVPFSELWHNVNELPAAKQGLIVARRAIEADDIAGLEAWAAENSAVINECGRRQCGME